MVPASTLQTHLRYTAWASKRLVDAAAALTPEELTRDFGTSEKSVLGTLVHVFAADRIWMARVEGVALARFFDPETDMHLSTLQNEWPALLDRWQSYAASLTEETAAQPIAYRDLKGNPYQSPPWQIILHLVNHGTHHRGQAAGMLRSMGKTPPVLDLIAFYRQTL